MNQNAYALNFELRVTSLLERYMHLYQSSTCYQEPNSFLQTSCPYKSSQILVLIELDLSPQQIEILQIGGIL